MKKILARHKSQEWFEKCGYGIIIEEQDKYCLVQWLGKEHLVKMNREYIYILDDKQKDGWR